MDKSKLPAAFEALYPTVAAWVENRGYIEIGYDDYSESFVRALDIGGMIWEGKHNYDSVEAAMQDLEKGIATWLEDNA